MTSNPPIFTVGTLRYDKRGLFVLFFWLMWNDFSITLIEQISGLNGFLMRDHGATLREIALIGMPVGLIVPFVNPIVSTWSDRFRSRAGRRRPFLFWATPPFAFFLAVTPFMPDLFQYFQRFPWFTGLAAYFPIKGDLLFIGICASISGLCNAVVMAIFSYLYWDVVPESHMGRFQSLSRNAAVLAGLVWSFCIFGFATSHMKEVYLWTATFTFLIYMISVWKIKEGEYPPPDKQTKGGVLAPILAYCVECFSQPYYLWIFLASLLFQLSYLGGGAINFYLHYDLKLDFWALGWASGWGQGVTTVFGLLFGFIIGSYTDRFKGVRLMAPYFIILGLVDFAAAFYVVDAVSLMIYSCAIGVINFAGGAIVGAFTIEVFPREKLGQFCSAQAVTYQLAQTLLAPFTSEMFDRLNNFRMGYVWIAACYLLSGIVYIKVYLNWKKRHGHPPVPHSDQIL